MSDELKMPAVIDLDVLLQPISVETPAGENVRYSGIYDEISEARRADDDLNQGEWKTDLKVADYLKVIALGVPVLSTQTKDLQIAVWVSEAVSRKHGFAGFRDSLLMLGGFQEQFWDTLYPEIDEGDMEGRANAISWLDIQFPLAIKTIPITGGIGYSFNDWEDSKRFEFPDDMASLPSEERAKLNELKAQAEKERRVTGSLWNVEKTLTRRAVCESINFVIEECWTAFNDLNRIIEEKYDRNQMPGLSNVKKALDDIHAQVKKLLEEKRLEEPDAVEKAEETMEALTDGEAVSGERGGGSVSGAINNRKDALRRLGEIAAFFQKTEPHSPVSYLVQRAVKWGNMGLETWLQEVIKDETVLFQLRETLGVGAGGSDGTAGAVDQWAQ